MREMIDRTKVRIKKQLWLLLLIPILTGAISYYMAAKEPAVSTANVEIVLGNFQDSILTNDKLMAENLKTEKYLKELTSTEEDYSGMAVELKEGKILSLTLSGDDEAEVEDRLNLIVDRLLEESRSVFEQKEEMLKKQISDMEEHNPGAESLPPLTDELLNLRETGIHQELVVTTTDGGTVKRGIFGVIVGLMLAAFLLVLPEIFRD
ncbi:hypothetical protein [Pseudalkalibacillus salsuginis]|uniref:hypothetical protein n=1 Tax=Pseudalkalibacillus salsuginis TaxID=2910972 RepID=UPI001F1EC05A|nr:hypothetical protein [Pseudalkalibacillus salsuginis]MCF6410136.1 hypothetical protein [Pseudalkalibacillus salsuginis]